jgi:hypothetical protein
LAAAGGEADRGIGKTTLAAAGREVDIGVALIAASNIRGMRSSGSGS